MAVEKNPFTELVRLLEGRLLRQRMALAATEEQLSGARKSESEFNGQQVLEFQKGKK